MQNEFFVAKERRPAIEQHEVDDPVWIFIDKPKRGMVLLGSQVHFDLPRGKGSCFRIPREFEEAMGLDVLKPGTCHKYSLQRSKQ